MSDNTPPFFDPAEDCLLRTPREIFACKGYASIAPNELDDCQLPGRLWELLYAAAAHRFFFHATDHLSDREFYTLLWEQWLDEPTPDIPPEAETNTTVFISEFDAHGMTHDEIWLLYYADEEMRTACSPDAGIPPHENPAFDRDRFLPTPPIPLEAHAGWLPGDDDPDEAVESESDPLGLASVDKEIAAAKLESTSEDASDVDSSDLALEAQLRAMEPENWTPPAQQLVAENIPLLPPQELTDDTLTAILWVLLHNLALRGFYMLHTNHLSDRELYAELWERGLRDPARLPGRNLRGGWFHDVLGSWGEAETELWLRYYASDEERAKHAREYPNQPLPAKQTPVSNRDWRLPKGPF
ncbi:MAG: hypothetical protein JWM68_1758 [Verrucomicrobiales bacterium]|nr:hypothetical protein [Verrucomicrobiales bacterium]